MKFAARNFKALKKLEIEFGDGITLIAGPTGAGKSSTVHGVAIACGIDVDCTKKALKELALNDEAAEESKRGAVEITGAAGSAKVSLPGFKRTTKDSEPLLDQLSLGLTDPLTWDARRWSEELNARFEAEPKREDFDKAFAKLDPAKITKIFDKVQTLGWDGAHAEVKTAHTMLKGQWEQAARTRFGKDKAAEFEPMGYDPDIDIDATQKRIEELQQISAEAQRGTTQEQLNELHTKASDIEAKKETLRLLTASTQELTQELAGARSGSSESCPECKTPLIRKSGVLVKADAVRATPEEIREIEKKLREEEIQRADAARKVAEAELAESKLRLIGDAKVIDAKAVEDAIADRMKLEQKVAAIAQKKVCDALFARIEAGASIVEQLGPDGIRKRALARALATMNKRLSAVCEKMSWPVVAIDPESLTVTIEGRPARFFSSEGQQWIARHAVQNCLIARAVPIWIDGADILDKEKRNGMFKTLHEMKIDAVVLMNIAREEIPRASWLRKYWIENGVCNEL